MAKRFTDSNKYKKTFIRGLQGAYKLLWDFLYHDCDHAGIWIVDFKIAQYYIGDDMPVNEIEAIKQFNNGEIRVVVIDDGKKWFVPSFIEFQYGKLSRTNKAHNNVILPLLKYNLIDENLNLIQFSLKGLISPLQGDKEKEMEKEMEKEKEEGEIYQNKSAPKKEDFLKFVHERCVTVGEDYKLHEKGASIKYDAWVQNGWKDLKGNKIGNWKSKIVSNLQYFKGASATANKNGTSLSGVYEPENGTNYDKIKGL
jgi:hypothetical protein